MGVYLHSFLNSAQDGGGTAQGSPGARWTGCCLDTTALGRHFEAELYFMHLPGFEP